MRLLSYTVPGWGVGELLYVGDRLVQHDLPRARPELTGPADDDVVHRLLRYFAGERVGFEDVPIDLSWATPFQQAAAETLRRVPYGEVVTYGELAVLAGYPGAQRAAGSFCAANPFSLIIPCHRVVAATGLGSYGSLGQAYKRRLLALEGMSTPLPHPPFA